MNSSVLIENPHQPQLDELRGRLIELSRDVPLDSPEAWPDEQLRLCADCGVFRWFIPHQWGGADWSTADTMRGYLKLSAACLTTTFILTQYTGACRRIAGSGNARLQDKLLPSLANGELFATVGISHLTTSRRHLKQPVLAAEQIAEGYVLRGMAPWVTGTRRAHHLVVGATLADQRQILACVPTDAPGVTVPPPAKLVGLSASQTGPVEFHEVRISDQLLLAAPIHEVMKQGEGANTGGVQTSTLATGLAKAAVDYLLHEARQRSDLLPAASALHTEVEELAVDVIRIADGEQICSNEQLRTRANSLALRSAQAALSAAKGTGYLAGHPAGRWCVEALFFLVWSCPQPVMAANLCELAGIAD